MPDRQDAGRHQIDCVCGRTTTGQTRPEAEVEHLTHYLTDHDDHEVWQLILAQEQLRIAKRECTDGR